MTVQHNMHFAEVGDSLCSQVINLSSVSQLSLKRLPPPLSLFPDILTKTRSTNNNQNLHNTSTPLKGFKRLTLENNNAKQNHEGTLTK